MAEPDAAAHHFVRTRPGVEGVVQRIGFRTAQVVLVAETGEWLRVVVPTVDEGREACERLGIPAHSGWPDDLRRRMGSYRRPPEDWEAAPYPERRRGTST